MRTILRILPLLGACALGCQQTSSRLFHVADVVTAKDPLAARPASGYLRDITGPDFEAGGQFQGASLVDFKNLSQASWQAKEIPNRFVQAAHLCFAEHRPMVLSPDMIWLLINQAAARHLLAHPEVGRNVLVQHEGKQTLVTRRDGFILGDATNDWPGVLKEFEDQVAQKAPRPDLVRLFSHPFQGSTATTLAARRATLLRGVSTYYDFYNMTGCGIPDFVLEGSPAEWRWIRQHAEDLKALGMEAQIAAWRPVLDQFVAASEGRVDAPFWDSFYKYMRESGGDTITGWIQCFLVDDAKRLGEFSKPGFDWKTPVKPYQEFRMNISTIPRGDIEQDFTWNYWNQEKPMRLRAGFLAVSQDAGSKALRPEISWTIAHATVPLGKVAVYEMMARLDDAGVFSVGELYALKNAWAISEGWTQVPSTATPEEKKASEDMYKKIFASTKFHDELIPHLTNIQALGVVWFERILGPLTSSDCEQLMRLPKLKKIIFPEIMFFDDDDQPTEDPLRTILKKRKDWELVEKRT